MHRNDPMPWGKFKGTPLRFCEIDYLNWLADNCDWDDEIREAAQAEIARIEETKIK